MVADHKKSAERLKAAAPGESVPATMDAEHKQILKQLRGASEKEFNQQYVQMQLAAHQKAVTLFESYSSNGEDTTLREFAQQTLPNLRDHLKMVEQIRNDLEIEARKTPSAR